MANQKQKVPIKLVFVPSFVDKIGSIKESALKLVRSPESKIDPNHPNLRTWETNHFYHPDVEYLTGTDGHDRLKVRLGATTLFEALLLHGKIEQLLSYKPLESQNWEKQLQDCASKLDSKAIPETNPKPIPPRT
jgi:hypothetical protein